MCGEEDGGCVGINAEPQIFDFPLRSANDFIQISTSQELRLTPAKYLYTYYTATIADFKRVDKTPNLIL